MFKYYSLIAIILLSMVFTIEAAVPQLINYQGMLTDADGTPVDGSRTILFKLFDAVSGGTELWAESHSVTIEEGIFNVILGSITTLDGVSFDPESLYLEITVGDDPPMTPRTQIVSQFMALHAGNADSLNGHAAGEFVQSINMVTPSLGNIDLAAGSNVTITPDDDNNRIVIAASGGSSTADNLGNHTATENIVLNGYWLSNDGDNEGIKMNQYGTVECSGNVGIANHLGVNNGGVYNTTYALYVNGSSYLNGALAIAADATVGEHLGVNYGAYSTAYALRVAGDAYATGSWLSSDAKFKTNIAAINNPLDQLQQLRGVTFKWDKAAYPDIEFSDGNQYGLIAQEVEKVFPDMVKTDENGDKAVAYYQLVPVLLEAIKQQQQQINTLQQEIANLK